MSSKPESQLWYKLRDGTKDLGVFWTRLESWASPGVPDLHGIIQGHPFLARTQGSQVKVTKVYNSTSTSNRVANKIFYEWRLNL